MFIDFVRKLPDHYAAKNANDNKSYYAHDKFYHPFVIQMCLLTD